MSKALLKIATTKTIAACEYNILQIYHHVGVLHAKIPQHLRPHVRICGARYVQLLSRTSHALDTICSHEVMSTQASGLRPSGTIPVYQIHYHMWLAAADDVNVVALLRKIPISQQYSEHLSQQDYYILSPSLYTMSCHSRHRDEALLI